MACVRRGKLLFSSFAIPYRSSFDALDSSRSPWQAVRMYEHRNMWEPVCKSICGREARCQGHPE